jgi:DNA repair protein RecO (recombination protein O)
MNDTGVQARRAARRGPDTRVDHQPAYMLHAYPWRETSLVVEVFTREFGRVALVARGAKRPTSHFRGVLSVFCPLLVAWSGRGEVKSLVRAEWCGGLAPLRGKGLLAGFYLNELLVRLLPRADAHEALFAAYGRALSALTALSAESAATSASRSAASSTLRAFELELLREIGFLPALDHGDDGAPIDADALYRIESQRGLVRVEATADELCIHGATALAMARGEFELPRVAHESKAVLRQLIRYHLEGRPLNTRRILQDLKEL